MRNTFNISFFCRQSKVNRQGLAHIEMSVNINGDRKFFNLPYQCKPSEFNKKRQPKEVKDYCDLMRSRVNEILTEMLAHGEAVTTAKILSYLRQGGYKSETVEMVFNEFLDIQRPRIGHNLTYNAFHKYEAAAGLFYEVVGKDKEFAQLTNADIIRFQNHLFSKYVKSSQAAVMTKVKTMVKFGRANGKLQTDIFNGIRIERVMKDVETITDEDLQSIIDTNYVSDRIQRIADLFVFSCGSGLAFCDTQELTEDDFICKDGQWCVFKERRKTGVKYYSVLLPCAVEVMMKYGFCLPKISNQKCNQSLKDVQDAAKITSVDSLHFHLARHYYAMKLLNAGVPVTTLQKCLGHKSIAMSLHYAHSVETTVINDVVQAIR